MNPKNCKKKNKDTTGAIEDEIGRLRDLLKSHERAGIRLESERDDVRSVLREVLAAPCDTSGMEYPAKTVLEAMSSAPYGEVNTPGKANADLLKRAKEAAQYEEIYEV
jgi:hypothetical protein